MLRKLASLFLLLLALTTQAAAPVEIVIPRLTQRVTDLTGTLTGEQQAAIESRLKAFEQQKGTQIAVLIVPSTLPETIEQYSIRVVDQWKLGREEQDDGVLILLAKNDRALRIEVGYGLEGVIPDVIAKRIIEEKMTPEFRQGNFAAGINAGIDALIGHISGEPLPEPDKPRGDKGIDTYFPLLFFIAIVAGGILRAVLGNFIGGAATGGLLGFVAWMLGAGFIFALIVAIIVFIMTLGGGRGFHGGGLGSGGFGGSGGGGFSGGGGGFGGGGASGRW